AVARIFSLEIITRSSVGNFCGRLFAIFPALPNPATSVIAQRFGHESQFRLMFTTDRDARGMNLRKGWIGKERAPFRSTISGCDIAAARIGREIKCVSVSAGGEHDGVGRVS